MYGSKAKRVAAVKKKGNIITFKERFAYGNGNARQIIVMGFKKTKSGAVKIIGRYYDSPWYDNIDQLLKAVDWEFMDVHNYLP